MTADHELDRRTATVRLALARAPNSQAVGFTSTARRFGGPWTLLKTSIVESYLRFFVKALKKPIVQPGVY